MPRSFAAAFLPLLFATAAWAANPSPMNSTTVEAEQHALPLECPEPEAATLQVGASAPMFSFQGDDGHWHHFQELIAHNPVVLVFGATDEDLKDLDRLHATFDDTGVGVVAVLHLPTRRTIAIGRRLGVTRTLVSDPMSAIASLYHSRESSSGRHLPAYFVIDTKGALRAMYYGPLPPVPLVLASAARGLGRPLPASAFTSTNDR